jgi:hypothetical protein
VLVKSLMLDINAATRWVKHADRWGNDGGAADTAETVAAIARITGQQLPHLVYRRFGSSNSSGKATPSGA